MTMKRILLCTLILMVLVTSGCNFLSGQEANSNQNTNAQPSPQAENNTIDFEGAELDVQAAVAKLKTPADATVNDLKGNITSAIQKLGREERNRCTNCSEETKAGAAEAVQALNSISSRLNDPLKKIKDLAGDTRESLQKSLGDQADKIKILSTAEPKRVEPPASGTPAVQRDQTENSSGSWWWSTLELALYIVGGLLLLVVLATGLTYLWKRSWMTIETNVGQVLKAHIAANREAQPDYAPKLSSLSSTQAEMSSRLSALETEVRSLARLVRESLAIRRADHNPSYSGGFNYQSSFEPVAQKDEPEFPVSAVDYLGKMDRFANVVRPDFQNGILVNAPDGDGELVLIRDSRDETQPLFVVPRATQFQTKQDFYTYYQKYYDCVRPSAGDVWIIGPAVVEKVTGGWQLREKGMLEVR